MRQQSGGYLADGHPAPQTAMVDTQGVPAAHPVDFSYLPVPPPGIDHLPVPPIGTANPQKKAAAPAQEAGVGDAVKGVADAALSGASRVSAGIVGAPVALANRLIAALHGGDPQMAADAAHDYVNSHFVHDATTPVGKQIGGAASSALAPVGNVMNAAGDALEQGGQKLGLPPGAVHSQLSELGDILGTAGTVAPVLAGARASTEAATLAAQNAPAAVTKYGMRTAAEHPIAAGAAGPSGLQALTLHNQPLGNSVLGAEAGVTHGTPLNYNTLEAAREAPNAVHGRVAAALPTAPLSPRASALVQSAGNSEDLVTHTPDAQAIIDAQKQRLLSSPLSGDQVVNNMRALRQEGYARVGSDDVEQQNIGRAQLDMSRALEQHVTDTLPPNAAASMPQLQAARVALAKNYAVQGALKGNNIDMQAIARMQRADPGLLTGGMSDIADFANQHPSVTGLANKIEVPPGMANDLGQAIRSGGMPQDILGRIFGASGVPAAARRVLTGNQADAMSAARSAPVTGLGGEFNPIEAQAPQAPLGMTASPPTAPPPTAAGPPGQIPLADLLSHGVEQGPPAGLSSAPMGTPSQAGVPFARNAGHEAGELSLADSWGQPTDMSLSSGERAAVRERTATQRMNEEGLERQPDIEPIPRRAAEHEGEVARRNNQDLASVMSQGVPEDIMARTSTPFANRGGGDIGSLKAASPEAINRGTRNVLEIDSDGKESPVLKDVSQIDAKAPKGHLLIDGDTHEIIDRGSLPLGHAKGLLNRWLAMRKPYLGDEF